MSDVAALGALVSAEDAAVFGIGTYGGRLAVQAPTSPALPALRAAYDAHRLRRDTWSATLRDGGADVPAAAPAYAVPATSLAVETVTAAAQLERRCAAAYDGALADLGTPATRSQVVAALRDSARRAAALLRQAGAAPAAATEALPGRDDAGRDAGQDG